MSTSHSGTDTPRTFIKKSEGNRLLDDLREALTARVMQDTNHVLEFHAENDWSFVIKSHALVEAAVTQLLVSHLGQESMKGFIERLPLSDSQSGKIALVKQLGLLDDHTRAFIRWFSELRNLLVHRPENVNFTFAQHVDRMDGNQRVAWRKGLMRWAEDWSTPLEKLADAKPKMTLALGLMSTVAKCAAYGESARAHRKLDRDSSKAMAEFFAAAEQVSDEELAKLNSAR